MFNHLLQSTHKSGMHFCGFQLILIFELYSMYFVCLVFFSLIQCVFIYIALVYSNSYHPSIYPFPSTYAGLDRGGQQQRNPDLPVVTSCKKEIDHCIVACTTVTVLSFIQAALYLVYVLGYLSAAPVLLALTKDEDKGGAD